MTLITENPFPGVLIFLLVIVASFGFSVLLKNKNLIKVGVAGVVFLVGLIVTEQLIVTDKEKLQAAVNGMAHCVRRNDIDGLLNFVVNDESDKSPKSARRRIEKEMPNYHFRGCRVGAVNVSVDSPNNKAVVNFFVSVNVDATKTHGFNGIAPRRVILTFHKDDDDEWRVVFFDHVDPRSNLAISSQ